MRIHRVLNEFIDKATGDRVKPATRPTFVPNSDAQAEALVAAGCLKPFGKDAYDGDAIDLTKLGLADAQRVIAGENDPDRLGEYSAAEEERADKKPRQKVIDAVAERLGGIATAEIVAGIPELTDFDEAVGGLADREYLEEKLGEANAKLVIRAVSDRLGELLPDVLAEIAVETDGDEVLEHLHPDRYELLRAALTPGQLGSLKAAVLTRLDILGVRPPEDLVEPTAEPDAPTPAEADPDFNATTVDDLEVLVLEVDSEATLGRWRELEQGRDKGPRKGAIAAIEGRLADIAVDALSQSQVFGVTSVMQLQVYLEELRKSAGDEDPVSAEVNRRLTELVEARLEDLGAEAPGDGG